MNAVGNHLEVVSTIWQESRQREVSGVACGAAHHAGAVPVIRSGIEYRVAIQAAAAREAHQRIVGMHLPVVAIAGSLRDTVEACAGDKPRMAVLPDNGIYRGPACGKRGAAGHV